MSETGFSREQVLANIDRAISSHAKRRIAKRAFEARIITRVDLMRALQNAKSAPDCVGDPDGEWSSAEDFLLISMVQKGESFRAIAERFVSRTRDACIGRAHRLGLKHPEAI